MAGSWCSVDREMQMRSVLRSVSGGAYKPYRLTSLNGLVVFESVGVSLQMRVIIDVLSGGVVLINGYATSFAEPEFGDLAVIDS